MDKLIIDCQTGQVQRVALTTAEIEEREKWAKRPNPRKAAMTQARERWAILQEIIEERIATISADAAGSSSGGAETEAR